MMRGAIVGLGNVALRGHFPAWKRRSDLAIVAGADAAPAQARQFLELSPQSAVHASLEECLAGSALDFVDICTPPHTHFELARRALEKKLHVLCEKPLVCARADMDRLACAAAESGAALFTVHNWKFAPILARAGELVRSGRIGEVRACEWYVLRTGPSVAVPSGADNWRLDPRQAGGGILIDHGWHALYVILGWMGLAPKSVRATLENRLPDPLPVEDTANVKIEFQAPGGAAVGAEIFLTWASRLRKNSAAIQGTAGRILIEDDVLTLLPRDGAAEKVRFEAALSAGSHHPDWFGSVIEEFLEEVRDPALRGRNLKVARACLEIIECAKRSSAQNSPAACSLS